VALHHRALKSANDLLEEVVKVVAKDAGVAVAVATVDHPIVIADAAVLGAAVLRVATANAATVHRHPDPEVVIETNDTAVHRRLVTMILVMIADHRRLILTICVIGMVPAMGPTVEMVVRPHTGHPMEVRIRTTAARPQVTEVGMVAVAAVLRQVKEVVDLLHRVVAASVVAGTKDLPV
jgi:hypothetical protein